LFKARSGIKIVNKKYKKTKCFC